MATATKHFIGGEWLAPEGPTMPGVNPATGQPIAEIGIGTAAEVDRAVGAARAAFVSWSETSGAARRKLLLKLAELIEQDAAELARVNTEDMGMPIGISLGDALYSAEYVQYFAGWADKLESEVIPVAAPKVLDYTLREPVGVVAGIVPWNAPINLTVWKLAPALATGCTVVIKPSEYASLAPLRIVELAARAGFPEGVLNAVTGTGSETGEALITHPGVDKVAFTGGTATGRHVAETCGRLLKRCSLELGGKSANVVFADADLDVAAMTASIACFMVTGQQCIAGSRLLVEERIHDEFVERVVQAAKRLTVGNPLDPATQLGPLVSDRQLERVLGYIDDARTTARIVAGGERLGGDLAGGYFVPPTVVTGVRNEMRLAREEIFGPVLGVITFRDAGDAIAIANDTEYGLAGGVWSNDLHTAHLVAKGVRAGTIWVNTWFGVSPGVPFGGFKASGLGREGGKEALGLYTETKNVYVQLRDPGPAGSA